MRNRGAALRATREFRSLQKPAAVLLERGLPPDGRASGRSLALLAATLFSATGIYNHLDDVPPERGCNPAAISLTGGKGAGRTLPEDVSAPTERKLRTLHSSCDTLVYRTDISGRPHDRAVAAAREHQRPPKQLVVTDGDATMGIHSKPMYPQTSELPNPFTAARI